MNKKNYKKLILDIAMAILFVTFFNKDLINLRFHAMSGCIFMIFIIAHIFLNKKWVINISKKLFDKNLNLRIKISYILSILLFITIFVIMLSGIFMMKFKHQDKFIYYKMMHYGASYISIILIGIHIGIYWNFVRNTISKILKINIDVKLSKLLSKIAIILVLIFGIYNIYSQKYLSNLSNTITYVIENNNSSKIELNHKEIYGNDKYDFGELIVIYGSIISVFSILTYKVDKSIKLSNKAKNEEKNKKKRILELR